MKTLSFIKQWIAPSSLLLLLFGNSYACWESAGAKFGIHPQLLYAIAKTESGLRPSAINRNTNGSYDIGLMQINSIWLPQLRRYGITEDQLWEPCLNIHVGAWVLAQNIRQVGNSWNAVGAYNSSKPATRLRYAQRVYKNLSLDGEIKSPPIDFNPK